MLQKVQEIEKKQKKESVVWAGFELTTHITFIKPNSNLN